MDTLTQVFIRNVTGTPSIQPEKFVLIASRHTGLYIWFLNFWETGSAKFEFTYSTAAHIQTAVSSVSWDSLEVTSFRHNSTVHPASETRQISATYPFSAFLISLNFFLMSVCWSCRSWFSSRAVAELPCGVSAFRLLCQFAV